MSLFFSFQTHSLFGGRTRRRRQAGGFQIAPGFAVPAENAKRLFWESYQRSVQREGVPRTETTPEVIPARRATASASRDPVTPTVRCGQTGVTGSPLSRG